MQDAVFPFNNWSKDAYPFQISVKTCVSVSEDWSKDAFSFQTTGQMMQYQVSEAFQDAFSFQKTGQMMRYLYYKYLKHLKMRSQIKRLVKRCDTFTSD
jgi:hypothetical protein